MIFELDQNPPFAFVAFNLKCKKSRFQIVIKRNKGNTPRSKYFLKTMTLRETKGNTPRSKSFLTKRGKELNDNGWDEEDDIERDKREYPKIEIISDQKRQRHETVARPRPG